MSLEFDTIKQKEEQTIADVDGELGQTTPESGIAYNRLWARAIGGLSKIFDRQIAIALRDVFLSTCKDLRRLLDWSLWTKTPRVGAIAAQINTTGPGTSTPSALIPGGINGVYYVTADGQKFYLESDYTIPLGGIAIPVLTAALAGTQANLTTGTLSITGQNSDISDTLIINESDPIVAYGRDEETTDSWRDEMQRVAKKPVIADNGSYYFSTARQRPNIIAGYPYAGLPGQMELYIRSDDETVNGVPTAPQLQDMQDYFLGDLDNITRVPLDLLNYVPNDATTRRFLVKAITPTDFFVQILGLSPNNTDNQTAITAAIEDYFETRAPYIKGVNVENNGNINKNALNSVIQGEIEIIGADSYSLLRIYRTSDGLRITEYSLGKGETVTVSAVTYL